MPEPAEREFYTASVDEISVPAGRVANPEVVKKLVKSIGKIGLINPLTVVDRGDDTFELVAGMNRLEACKELGISSVWVVALAEGEPRHEIEFEENLVRLHLAPEQLKEHRKWVKEELKRRVASGESVRAAATALGVPKSSAIRECATDPNGSVAHRIGTDGKSRPKENATPASKARRSEAAKKLRRAGKTVSEIARDHGVSRRTTTADLATPDGQANAAEPAPSSTTESVAVDLGSGPDLVHRVRDADSDAPISVETLANLIGTKPKVVVAWESGAREPTGPERVLLWLLSRDDGLDKWIETVLYESLPDGRDTTTNEFDAWLEERVAAVRRGELEIDFRQGVRA